MRYKHTERSVLEFDGHDMVPGHAPAVGKCSDATRAAARCACNSLCLKLVKGSACSAFSCSDVSGGQGLGARDSRAPDMVHVYGAGNLGHCVQILDETRRVGHLMNEIAVYRGPPRSTSEQP